MIVGASCRAVTASQPPHEICRRDVANVKDGLNAGAAAGNNRDMRPELTPAVERALGAAARWRGAADGEPLGLPQVLLGLLSQSECRAAVMLARHGVTAAAVKRRWPH